MILKNNNPRAACRSWKDLLIRKQSHNYPNTKDNKVANYSKKCIHLKCTSY